MCDKESFAFGAVQLLIVLGGLVAVVGARAELARQKVQFDW